MTIGFSFINGFHDFLWTRHKPLCGSLHQSKQKCKGLNNIYHKQKCNTQVKCSPLSSKTTRKLVTRELSKQQQDINSKCPHWTCMQDICRLSPNQKESQLQRQTPSSYQYQVLFKLLYFLLIHFFIKDTWGGGSIKKVGQRIFPLT